MLRCKPDVGIPTSPCIAQGLPDQRKRAQGRTGLPPRGAIRRAAASETTAHCVSSNARAGIEESAGECGQYPNAGLVFRDASRRHASVSFEFELRDLARGQRAAIT